MAVVFDTNEVLHYPENLFQFDKVIIPIVVIEELDKLKRLNDEIGYKARNAIKAIASASHVEIDDINQLYPELQINGWERNNDNLVISSALRYGCKLVTGDLSLSIKAQAAGVKVLMNGHRMLHKEYYTGVREIVVTDSKEDQDLLAEIYQGQNPLGMLINEYLIIRNENGKTLDIMRYNGEKLVHLSMPKKHRKGDRTYVPEPKNDHQRCAIDLLNNTEIPIKIIAGTYGSGKTLLSVRMGLYHIKEAGNYSRMLVVRNPIGSGEEIGFLPGTKDEKIREFFKPIEQQLEGGEFELQSMMQKGEILWEIPFYMKGQSLNDGYFVLVDEAEDLDLKTLKLIGTRIGEDSCIVFAGDYNQAEKPYIRDNGLMQAIEKLKGNPLVGIVVLQEDVRSEASKIFASL